MIHIMIPACGNNQQFLEGYWPKNVTEINGKVMIEYVIENFKTISDKHFVIILNEKECLHFHTDNMVSLLTDGNADIIQLEGETGGALCTCLMAIEKINDDNELIISNNDQKFDCDLLKQVEEFRREDADGGVLCFDCVHPRWSYVREEQGVVVEVAEKRPISKKAIAGIYYFKHASDFLEVAQKAILKGQQHDDKYFISAAVNEMILAGKKVVCHMVPSDQYHTFYEPGQIRKYEQELQNENNCT